jgi:hypothetical protein
MDNFVDKILREIDQKIVLTFVSNRSHGLSCFREDVVIFLSHELREYLESHLEFALDEDKHKIRLFGCPVETTMGKGLYYYVASAMKNEVGVEL